MMINASNLRDRALAGAVHLAISALIASLAIVLVFFMWYPWPLSEAQGVDRIVLLMIGGDVVLGPVTTFLIFVRAKRGLKFDLAVIAVLQTTAFLYGMKIIQDGRPAYVVFNIDRFAVIASAELDLKSLSRVQDRSMRPTHFGPNWVAARLPTESEKRTEILFSAISGGADLAQLPEYFVPLDTERQNMVRRLRPLTELRTLNRVGERQWREFILELGKSPAEMGYLPMRANAKDGAVIMDSTTGRIIGIRMLTPAFASRREGRTSLTDDGLTNDDETREARMKQASFGDAEYTAKRKQTRREEFLTENDQILCGRRCCCR